MAHALPSHSGPRARSLPSGPKNRKGRDSIEYVHRKLAILAVAALLAPFVFAQVSARVTGVDPQAGKVNDTVTVTGQNLAKDSVSAAFLSDDATDYKAVI